MSKNLQEISPFWYCLYCNPNILACNTPYSKMYCLEICDQQLIFSPKCVKFDRTVFVQMCEICQSWKIFQDKDQGTIWWYYHRHIKLSKMAQRANSLNSVVWLLLWYEDVSFLLIYPEDQICWNIGPLLSLLLGSDLIVCLKPFKLLWLFSPRSCLGCCYTLLPGSWPLLSNPFASVVISPT